MGNLKKSICKAIAMGMSNKLPTKETYRELKFCVNFVT